MEIGKSNLTYVHVSPNLIFKKCLRVILIVIALFFSFLELKQSKQSKHTNQIAVLMVVNKYVHTY